jgi:hypothetical protein
MTEQEDRRPAFSDESCKTPPLPSWTEQEKWVWKQIYEGKVANLNEAIGEGLWFDPEKPDTYPQRKVLSPTFLETILLHEPYRSSIPHQGIRIIGAWFQKPLDLSFTKLDCVLLLNDCVFEAEVEFRGLKTSHPIFLRGSKFIAEVNLVAAKIGFNLEMDGSIFTDKLVMESINVANNLFLRGAIFSQLNLKNAIIGGDLEINGSKFSGKLDMNFLEIKGILDMTNSEFREAWLVGAKIMDSVKMIGSKFNDTLYIESIKVEGSLFMRSEGLNITEFNDVIFRNGRIGGQLDMRGSKFSGELNMNGLQVGGNLFMRSEENENRGEFNKVMIRNGNIGNQLDMNGSKFIDKLDMDNLQVGNDLFMGRRAEFKNVRLAGAKIGGQLSTDNSEFKGTMDMESIHIGQNLLMRLTTFKKEENAVLVNLTFASIFGSLTIEGSKLPTLNLSGAKILGEFRLAKIQPPQWHEDAKLILRDTDIGTIQDLPGAWPDKTDLKGFTYSRLSGLMANRDVKWFKQWLATDSSPHYQPYDKLESILPNLTKVFSLRSHSLQPYEQLANVLAKAGHKQKADDVMYSGRERERDQATELYWFWLTVLKYFIGYGYRLRYSLFWVIGLVILGTAVLYFSTPEGKAIGLIDSFWYSADTLLPIIKLLSDEDKIKIGSGIKYYFYFHKIMGYVLAIYIGAGLSGLTKK